MKTPTDTIRYLLTGLCMAGLLALPVKAPGQTETSVPIVCAPMEGLNPAEKVGPVVMSKMALPQVLELLQTFSGRTIIPGAGAPTLSLTFRTPGQLRRDEAILALETLLRLNGVILVKGEDQFVQARPASQAITSGPVLLDATRLEELEGQQIYGRIFDLEHVTSGTAFLQVRGMLSPGGLSSIANLTWRDSLMVFDTRQNLDAIARVVELLDQPTDRRAEVFIVPVINSSVQNLHSALTHAQRNRADPALNRARFQINRQANHIVVVAPREDREYIEELVKLLDQDIAPMTTSKVLPLRYGNLRSVYGIINNIIRHQQRAWDRSGLRAPDGTRVAGDAADADSTDRQDETGVPDGDTAAPIMPSAEPGHVVAELQHAAEDLQFSPYMSLWMDMANNALVAYGTPADIARTEALMAELDREAAPLLVSEVIHLNHAFAPSIGTLITRMINAQRAVFRREQLGSPDARRDVETPAGLEPAAEAEAAFDFSQFMTIFTERAGNALIVYGTRSDLEKIKPLIAQLDREYAPVTEGKMRPLQHSDARSVASLMSRIITMQQRAYAREGIFIGVTRDSPAAEPIDAGGEVGFEFTPYAMVQADRASNALFLYGTVRDIQRMEELVAELDQETAPYLISEVITLNHAFAPSVGNLISRMITTQRNLFRREGLQDPGARREADVVPPGLGPAAEAEAAFEFSPFMTVFTERAGNAILVYGTRSDLEKIKPLIAQLDREYAPVTEGKMRPLQHSDARSVASLMSRIITMQQRAYAREGIFIGVTRDSPAAEPIDAGGEVGFEFTPYAMVQADRASNALFLYGTVRDIQRMEELVAELDQETAPYLISEVITLNHAFAPSVGNLISRMITTQRNLFRREGLQDPGARREADVPSGLEPAAEAEAAFEFSPFMTVFAERTGNAILVYGTRSDIERIKPLIAQLDREYAPVTEGKMVTLRHSDANHVANMINRIIAMQQRAYAREGIFTGVTRDSPVAQPIEAGGEVGFEFTPYAMVQADRAGNSVFLYGTTRDIQRMEELIAELDQEKAPYLMSEVITLRHAFAPSIGGLLNSMVNMQRNLFRREGLGHADARRVEDAEVVPGAVDQTFEFSPYMYIWTERTGNAILVFGTRGDIEKIKPLIAQLDREYAPVTTGETVTIKHAQAISVASTVHRIVTMQQWAFTRQGIRVGVTRDPEAAMEVPESAEIGFEFTPYAMLHADRTTNAIFLYGTIRDVERMKALIAELDRETAPITRSQMFYLRHAQADQVSRLVSSLVMTQRRTFQQRGLRIPEGEERAEAERQVELEMGFEFSDFATVIADRRSNGILVYGTDGDIRRIEKVIEKADIAVEPITTSRIFPLRHADANHLSRVLQIIVTGQRRALQRFESVGVDLQDREAPDRPAPIAEGDPALQFSPFLSIVPDARNNALIVYGTHADVEHVGRLVEQTDVEVAPMTVSEVFLLKHAQASQVASMLMGVINNQRRAMALVQSQFRAVQFRAPRDSEEPDPTVMETLFDPGQSMQFSPYVSVVANPRNNSLLAYGTAADIDQLRELVAQSDIEVAPRTQSRVFVIRHGDANDIVRTLNPLIQAQQRVREREATLRRFFRPRPGDENQEDVPLTDRVELEGILDSFDDMGVDLDRDLQFSPYISLTADTRANTVIAYGTSFDLEQVEYLVNQIDRVLPQVRIEVVIAEVSLSEGQVSGLSSFGFAYDNPFDFQRGAGIIAAGQRGVAALGGADTMDDNGNNNGQQQPDAPSFMGRGGVIAAGPQLDTDSGPALDMGLTFDPFSMRTVFRVARDDRNVRILSAPSITTTHNRPAHINVGEARPIITSSTATLDRSLATRSEIEYRDIGIQLTVRPLISEQGMIQLDIEQIVETVVDTQTIDNNIQPIIGTRRANSFVSVFNQEILIMGGLQSVETTMSEGRVFLLGDIPLLGRLFRPKRRISTVRELIIFIRPEIVESAPSTAMFDPNPARRGPAEAEAARFYETGQFESNPRGVREPEPTRLQRMLGRGDRPDMEEEPEATDAPETGEELMEPIEPVIDDPAVEEPQEAREESDESSRRWRLFGRGDRAAQEDVPPAEIIEPEIPAGETP